MLLRMFRGRAALLLSLGLLAACSAIRVETDWDPKASFAGLRDYAWRPGPQQGPADPRIDNTLLDARVRSAVDGTLQAKGYARAEETAPDFLVGYHVVLQQKVDVRTVGGFYGYRGGWGAYPTTYAYEYEEGTLLIDLIDPKTNQLLWRGSATATVDAGATPAEREERVRQAVQKILERFPPE